MTIFALSSGRGKAGVAVIRISGPGAEGALCRLAGGALCRLAGAGTGGEGWRPAPRRAALRELRDPTDGTLIDRALVLWFPGPRSFTGEDVAEFHIHGGRAVIAHLARALGSLDGVRPAQPGEFTRRAFEHAKMDLTEAEGLADLVAAETEAQKRQALGQLGGGLGRLYEGWRAALVAVMAHVEATIDFTDEELPGDVLAGVGANIRRLAGEIRAHVTDNHRGERLREGLRCVLIGAPNVGKSSLLNALARRDVAIVSPQPGTTRDVLEVHLDLGGYPVTLADTAGLRTAGDPIEAEGVRRAEDRARDADMRIAIVDAQAWPKIDPAVAGHLDGATILAVNKIDLVDGDPLHLDGDPLAPPPPLTICPISALTGDGIADLLVELEGVAESCFDVAGPPALTRERHRAALNACLEYLTAAAGAEPGARELMAEDLRMAARALGRITGRVDVEDILDVVFREFCIGK